MRRDYVTLDVRHTEDEDDGVPTLVLTVDEATDLLDERLRDDDRLDADGIDVAFRLRDDDRLDAGGVFSLSNRVTGEFVLEVNADASDVLDLVDCARTDDANGEGCYRVEIRHQDEQLAVYEKRTLLVYDPAGSLLRQRSLIPSGVEL